MMIKRLILLGALAVMPLSFVSASPNAKEVKSKLRETLKSERQFSRLYAKLSPTQKAALLASIESLGLPDSDGDGLPDILEDGEGSSVCDNDSDDDGKDDGSEIEDGDKTDDSDSDDDGRPDGEEVESKGKISSVTSPTEFVIGDRTWIVTNSTSFEKMSASEIAVGVCVEVEGHSEESNKFTADKVQKEDRCKS